MTNNSRQNNFKKQDFKTKVTAVKKNLGRKQEEIKKTPRVKINL